jgi:hypothetical protein
MKIRKYTVHRLKMLDKYPASIEDMLRYDGAFINRKYPGLLLLPHWYSIRSKITEARWNTFGYTVSEPIKQEDILPPFNIKPKEWFTYLGSVWRCESLDKHLKAKNWQEI